MKKHTIFIIFVVVIALAIGIWRDQHEPELSASNLSLQVGTAFPQPRKLPNFKLTDMNGQSFTQHNLINHWSFVFFGYTKCPNLCPATLASLSQLSTRIARGPHVQFLFLSIDPENDTPEQLKSYLHSPQFQHGGFIGLTGEIATTQLLIESIGLHLARDLDNKETQEHIGHSGTVLLINPEGKIAALFTNTDKPNIVAKDFKDIVHFYNRTAV